MGAAHRGCSPRAELWGRREVVPASALPVHLGEKRWPSLSPGSSHAHRDAEGAKGDAGQLLARAPVHCGSPISGSRS